jgi:hypothetical protein
MTTDKNSELSTARKTLLFAERARRQGFVLTGDDQGFVLKHTCMNAPFVIQTLDEIGAFLTAIELCKEYPALVHYRTS